MITLLIALNAMVIGTSCNHNNQAKDNQKYNTNVVIRCDTMTKESFFILAKKIRAGMDERKDLSFEQAVQMVKVYNTFHTAAIAKDEKQLNFSNEFIGLFEKNYLDKIMRVLKCSFGKGMTVYSKKHDLYIGSAPEFRCKDIYTIL